MVLCITTHYDWQSRWMTMTMTAGGAITMTICHRTGNIRNGLRPYCWNSYSTIKRQQGGRWRRRRWDMPWGAISRKLISSHLNPLMVAFPGEDVLGCSSKEVPSPVSGVDSVVNTCHGNKITARKLENISALSHGTHLWESHLFFSASPCFIAPRKTNS